MEVSWPPSRDSNPIVHNEIRTIKKLAPPWIKRREHGLESHCHRIKIAVLRAHFWGVREPRQEQKSHVSHWKSQHWLGLQLWVWTILNGWKSHGHRIKFACPRPNISWMFDTQTGIEILRFTMEIAPRQSFHFCEFEIWTWVGIPLSQNQVRCAESPILLRSRTKARTEIPCFTLELTALNNSPAMCLGQF